VRFTTVGLVTVAAGVAGLGYSFVEAGAFTVRRSSVPVLPAGTSPIRVLHVSDLHLVPRQRRKTLWMRKLAELEPDLVISTGDTMAARDAVRAALWAYEPLLRLPGVFVLGSNDYFAPQPKNPARYLRAKRRNTVGEPLPVSDLVRGFRDAGWHDLTNRRTHVKVAGHELEFVGVDDPHLRLDRYARVSAPADPEASLTVGVCHAPYRRVLDAMAADGARLILAGHTHGGQLCIPFRGAIVTNCDIDRPRAKGLSRWAPGGHAVPPDDPEAAWLHVSAGLGTSPYTPVRFACRPEATLLTLTPSNADPGC
jgi:uncharacterized protein